MTENQTIQLPEKIGHIIKLMIKNHAYRPVLVLQLK